MTDTQELLEQAFEINLNNYGPEDVERLNDWAINAYAALEALQAEHTDEVMRGLMLEKAHAMGLAERDAALARLAEIENQEPAYLLTPDGKCYAYGSAQPLSAGHADATLLKLYAAAGASLVATPIVAWAKSTPRKLRITTMDMGGEDGWRPLGYTAAGASPQQSPLLQFCTCEDCKPMECEGCRINRERRELLPAPSDASREYMTGYSDCKEWAQLSQDADPNAPWLSEAHMLCTDQGIAQGNITERIRALRDKLVQPSQAGELNDAKRLDWIRDQLFEHKWNGVVGKGCAVQWVVAPDFRFKQRELTDDSGIAAGDFRRAIDAVINAKEQPNG